MTEKNGLPKPPKEAADSPRKDAFPGEFCVVDKVVAVLTLAKSAQDLKKKKGTP